MPFLRTDEKLKFIFTRFFVELQAIKSIYERDKEDPYTGRNMPMFSGRILWARQLFRKIETPMSIFKEHVWLFRSVFSNDRIIIVRRDLITGLVYYHGNSYYLFTPARVSSMPFACCLNLLGNNAVISMFFSLQGR